MHQLHYDFCAGVLRLSLIQSIVILCSFFFLQRDHERIKALSDRLIDKINLQVEHVVRNGDPNGYAGCVNLSFSYVEGESLLMALKVHYAFDFAWLHFTQFRSGYRTFIW